MSAPSSETYRGPHRGRHRRLDGGPHLRRQGRACARERQCARRTARARSSHRPSPSHQFGRARYSAAASTMRATRRRIRTPRCRQFKDRQITIGKNFNRFGLIGPCIVITDEMTQPGVMRLTNGSTARQDGNKSEWLFHLPQRISFLSQIMTRGARRHRYNWNARRRWLTSASRWSL
jgi:hypothetical protein